jgi:hypothetical protein
MALDLAHRHAARSCCPPLVALDQLRIEGSFSIARMRTSIFDVTVRTDFFE